jgi:hypothetical protein
MSRRVRGVASIPVSEMSNGFLSDMRFLLMRGAALALVGVRNPRGCGLHLTYAARFSADLEL